jgi:RNA recognition motif-containing protein
MSKKVYVDNLNYGTTEDTLRSLFSQHGEVVSVNLITDRYTGESKGFGFVEMASEGEANGAISALNGRDVDGRKLRVDIAQERQRGGGGGGGGRNEGRNNDNRSSYRY